MSTYINDTPTTITIKVESTDLGSAEKCGDVCNGALLLPTHEIKTEPTLVIDDTEHVQSDENDLKNSQKIRLKHTSKLFPDPNPTCPKRRFVCPLEHCTKAYGKSSHLRSHLIWHSGVKPFVCKEPNCGRGFTRSDELNRHIRTHTGEKPFSCMHCPKTFARSDHLTKHVATHNKNNGTLITTTAATTTTTTTTTTTIKRTSSNNNNNNNNNNFNGNTVILQQHQQQQQHTHEQEQREQRHQLNIQRQQQLQQQQQQRRQQQQQRQLQYTLQQERLLHMTQQQSQSPQQQQQTYHQQQPEIPRNHISNNNNNNLQFSDGMHFMAALISGNDGLDNMETITPDVKLEHIPFKIKLERPENATDYQVVHPHQQHQQQLQRQYQQQANLPVSESEDDIPAELIVPESTMICPADDVIITGTGTTSAIQRTPAILDPERPFHCTHCEKRFKRQDDLNRHVRTHTGEKPFACSNCERRFMRGDHLKKHMRTHTKAR